MEPPPLLVSPLVHAVSTGNNSAGAVQTNSPTSFGIAVTAGVPITLTAHRHINFHVAPFIGFAQGVSSLDVYVPNQPPTSYVLSNTIFRLGGRAAAEVHLGFLGLPQVSIEASLGLYLQYRATNNQTAQNGTVTSTGSGAFELGTSLGQPKIPTHRLTTMSLALVRDAPNMSNNNRIQNNRDTVRAIQMPSTTTRYKP